MLQADHNNTVNAKDLLHTRYECCTFQGLMTFKLSLGEVCGLHRKVCFNVLCSQMCVGPKLTATLSGREVLLTCFPDLTLLMHLGAGIQIFHFYTTQIFRFYTRATPPSPGLGEQLKMRFFVCTGSYPCLLYFQLLITQRVSQQLNNIKTNKVKI